MNPLSTDRQQNRKREGEPQPDPAQLTSGSVGASLSLYRTQRNELIR